MSYPLGAWRSPGGTRNRTVWERARKAALDRIEPEVAQQSRSVFGLEPPQIRPTASPAMAGQRARFGAGIAQARRPAFNLGRPQQASLAPPPRRPSPAIMQQPGPLNPPAQIAPPGAPGAFAFQGGRNIMELLTTAGTAIGNMPLPGGLMSVTPSVSGGRPGVSLSGFGQPEERTVGTAAEFERNVFQPVTKPAGRFAGRTVVESVVPPGVPGRERAVEIGGDVGAAVAGEVLLPTNLIPIPIIDPLAARAVAAAARLAKVAVGPAARVTRTEGRRLVDALGRAIASEPDEAVRGALAQFRGDLERAVAERPVAGAAREPSRGAQPAPGFEPEPSGDLPNTLRTIAETGKFPEDPFEPVQGLLSPEDIRAGQRHGVKDIVGAQLERDAARLESRRRTALARELGRDPLAGTRLPPSVGGRDLPGEALLRRERLSESDLAKGLARDYPRRPRFQSSTPLRRGEEDVIGDALERLSGQPDRVIPISVTHRGVGLEDFVRQVDETKQILDRARARLTTIRRNVKDGIVPQAQMAEAAEDLTASRVAWRQSQAALRDSDIRVAFDDIATRARAAGADENFVNILRTGYEDSLRLIPNDEPLLTASALRQRIARTVAAIQGTPPGTIGAIAQQRHIVETVIRRQTEEELALIANTLDRALYREIDNITYVGSSGQGADWWKAMSDPEQLVFIETNAIKDYVIVQHPDWWSGMSPELRQALKQAQSFQAGKLRIAETMGYPIKAIERPYLEQLWEVPRSVLETPLPGFQGKVSIAKERAFGDYIEGVRGGLEPKDMTVGELVEHSSSLMDEAIGDAFERRLVLERFGVRGQRPVSSGYRQFNTPLYAGFSAPSPIVNFVDQLHSPIMFSALRRGGPVANVAAAVKGTVFGIMDFGVFGTHLIDATALGGPRIVGAMINRGLRTMNLPHVGQIWLDNNLDAVVRHGLDGVNQGMGPSAVQIKGGTLAKYVPFVGEQLDRPISAAVDTLARIQFGNMLRPIRNLMHEGNLIALHLTGSDITDPAVRRTAADSANAIGGASRGAMTPGRRQVETVFLTSFQMGRSEMARYQQIAKAFLSPTATKEERILGAMSLASFGATVYALGSAINMWMGNGPVEFDPRRGDWAAIEVKGQKVPLIGRRALIRAIAKSYDVLAKENPTEVARIWTQYAVAKMNPLTAPIQSALGIGFEGDARGFQVGTLSTEARLLNMAPLPPLAGSLLTEPRSRNPTAIGFEAAGFNVFPKSQFEIFREAFREEFGRDYDGKEGDRTIAQSRPRLRELLEEADRATSGFGFGLERQEREAAIAGLADDLRPFAEGIRAGNPDAGSQFLRAYSSFKTQRSGVFQRDFFGEEFPERETEVGRAREALGEMNPNAAPYLDADPETGTFQVDWDLWDADQERQLDIIEREHPGFTKYYKTRSFLPEEFADVERQAIAARGLRDQLREISPIRGLSITQWEELQDFWRDVNEERDAARLRGREIGFEEAIRALAAFQKRDERDPGFTEAAVLFRSGTRARDTMRNREYDLFLLRNFDVLWPFYQDDLYSSRRMQDLIFQAKQNGLIGETTTAAVPVASPVLEPAGVR